ncbi:hypothetical protein [Marinobacter sp. F3R08]|uniref:hypothetical protein n=1 Tax=Marinobacter sp. F3R08 TaxID=2841559 RepID=UPI001C082E16|nr:hypothetical protein [Marinobacter sp. F3R08]MBU2955000.1 hypothetical protein [Marinobacter sp. F3R08]
MRFSILIGGLLMAFVAAAAAAAPPDCVIGKYQAYTQTQKTWQGSVTQLVVEMAPEYEDVAKLYLENQLRSVERREIEVAFFAHAEPAKLRTQMPLNNWLSLSEADRQRIASENQRYAQLREQARAARSEPAHPDGNGLRDVMQTEVMQSPAYKKLMQRYLESMKAAEGIECAKA